MTLTTEGIVVRQTRYGDNGVVVGIYTRAEGMRSFMVRGGLKPGGKFRSSCFFPLSQVEITYNSGKEGGGMPFLREIKLLYPYREMYADVRKSSVAFFLSEVMARFITQSEQDEFLYNSMAQALRDFDSRSEHIAEFHLFFFLELIAALGFYPRMAESGAYFDLREGCFRKDPPLHRDFLEGDMADSLCRLLHEREQQGSFPHCTVFQNASVRFNLLQSLAHYCQLQTGSNVTLKSLSVLKELFA